MMSSNVTHYDNNWRFKLSDYKIETEDGGLAVTYFYQNGSTILRPVVGDNDIHPNYQIFYIS